MSRKLKFLNTLLVALLLIGAATASSGYGRSATGVAEILAAGLITRLLMDSHKARPMIHRAMRHHFMGGYGHHMHSRHPMHSMHPMHPMLAARIPMMMNPYVFPMMPQQQYNVMNHALMGQVSKHEALASRLNEEIQALQEQESMLEAALARTRHQGSETSINELLSEQDTIPAAALLLETAEFMTPATGLDHPRPLSPPEILVADSEPESRYILPRIVRHFVQRLMRRGELH